MKPFGADVLLPARWLAEWWCCSALPDALPSGGGFVFFLGFEIVTIDSVMP